MSDSYDGYIPGNYNSGAKENQVVAINRPCEFLYAALFNDGGAALYLWVLDRTTLIGGDGQARPVCTPVQVPAGSTGWIDRSMVPRRMSMGIVIVASTTSVTPTLSATNDAWIECTFRIPLPPRPPPPPAPANQATPQSTK